MSPPITHFIANKSSMSWLVAQVAPDTANRLPALEITAAVGIVDRCCNAAKQW